MFDGEEYSSGLVRYLDEHVNMGMSDRAIERLAANIRAALKTPMNAGHFNRTIGRTEAKLESYDDDTTITLYVRELLNNSPESHKTRLEIMPGYLRQAVLRGGTSTILYIVSILKEPEILLMMEESFERHPFSILGRMTRRTRLDEKRSAVMRRPVLMVPGHHTNPEIKAWERQKPQTKYFEEGNELFPKEIELDRYEEMIKEAREASRANQ